MVPLEYYLVVAGIIFTIGMIGVIVARNIIIIFMSIELMLNSANLTLVAFSAFMGDVTGQMIVFFSMTVAAAEAAVGLAIIISMFRNKQTVNLEDLNILKW